ncbi:MAG TPA: hypothetical protein VFA44_09035 [Gaiellaceae bacterium]|nr:hypothetical protein [Gaiellaceae bacterium]
MTKRTTPALLAVAAVVGLTAAAAGVASAAPAAKPKVVPIVMHDPGCHWFLVGGKYKASLTVKGTTAFRNLDEAALVFKGRIFKGRSFYRRVAVGKTLTITKPGVYEITMVRQARDDNHLRLVVV